MNKETGTQVSFFSSLLSAAIREDWRMVDSEFVPKLSSMNGDVFARNLLKNARNKNPNVRDLVATCLPHLKITSKRVHRDAIRAMIIMASSDMCVFPAGRAALYLLKQPLSDDEIGIKIKEALETFKHKVKEYGWEEQLKKDIPELADLLT